jgi:hypothetical protein
MHRGPRGNSRHFRYFQGKLCFPVARKGRCREQRCFEAFPMFRGQPPRIDHLMVLGVERTTIGPAMLDALSIMMPSARSTRPVPQGPLDRLGVASFSICHGQQPVLPVGRGGCPAGANGHGKLRVDLLPFLETVRMNAKKGRAALEAPAFCHQRYDALTEFRPVRGGSSTGMFGFRHHAYTFTLCIRNMM